MYNNNIPQFNNNMQRKYPNKKYNNDDRIIARGFFCQFIIGVIIGGLIANSRPNYPIYYQPYPYYPYPYFRPY